MIKKIKSLNEDQLSEMLWSNDWEIVEKTQELLIMLKKAKIMDLSVHVLQELIDKRYNIIAAQMILDEVKN
jgi:hypothetical protein